MVPIRRLAVVLVLLIGCGETHHGAVGPAVFLDACDIADGYTWLELDGGTCGPLEQLETCSASIDLVTNTCAAPAGQVVCDDGSRWSWNVSADAAGRWTGRVSVRTTDCDSVYGLEP